MATAQHLVAAGDPQGALELLQAQVRARAADPKLRVFLFQLLCVLGQWQRASTQLQVCGELDAATLPMVNTYREALQCELVREEVFAGKTTPIAFGQPQAWVAWLAEALQTDARGDAAGAARLRTQAFDAAPVIAGSLNGTPFDWIADADSRLGPVIEAPVDLRDLVWVPARFQLNNGGETAALLPTRYPGTGACADGALQLSRKTEWLELSPGHYRGLGQRLLTTSGLEVGLFEAREIVLQAPPVDSRQPGRDPEPDPAH